MKGYVVTLFELSESVKMAERCIQSCNQFEIDAEMFPAVWKTNAFEELKKEGLTKAKWDESFSNPEAVIGNFISQYRIWKKILETNQGGIVFEHDAVVVGKIPDNIEKYDIVNIGKPSYGQYRTMSVPGIYKMFSKQGGLYAPGAHGYYVSPKGAADLIKIAQQKGASPCDLYLSNRTFPNIMEVYPWPVEAHDEFTTIQNQKGCLAKTNFNEKYKIIK